MSPIHYCCHADPGTRYDAIMGFFSRKRIHVALFCYTVFLLYATLWPFDFYFDPAFTASRKISWIPFFDPSDGPNRKDAAMNIIVFLPFGILSFLVNSAAGKMHRPVLIATVLGCTLSFSIEVAQIWLPLRHPSTADLLMNATGVLLGAVLARSWERNVRTNAESVRLVLGRNTAMIAVIVYALALLASTMRTFDPILSWESLYARAQAFPASTLLPDHLDLDYTTWMVLTFGFLSFLAVEGFAGSTTIRRRAIRYAAAFGACSAYAVLLEALQILFRSRQPLLSHAFLGIVGVAYGIAWHAATDRFRIARNPGPIQGGIHESGKSHISPAISLLFLHYTLLIILAFLSPIPHSIGGFRFDPHGFIPFFFYLRDISLPSLYTALKTIVLQIPVGIMMHSVPVSLRNRTGKIPVLFSAGLQAMIEIVRGFSGYQFPDPSNVFLAALGSYAGTELLKSIRTHI